MAVEFSIERTLLMRIFAIAKGFALQKTLFETWIFFTGKPVEDTVDLGGLAAKGYKIYEVRISS